MVRRMIKTSNFRSDYISNVDKKKLPFFTKQGKAPKSCFCKYVCKEMQEKTKTKIMDQTNPPTEIKEKAKLVYT